MRIKLVFILLLSYELAFGQSPNIIWEKTFGGGSNDRGLGLFVETNNIYLCGQLGTDALYSHLDSVGAVLSLQHYGGSHIDYAANIIKNFNGNLIFVGSANSNDGDVIGHHGTSLPDYWIVCLDSINNILWQKCLGGSMDDNGISITQTPDSGYIIYGYIYDGDGDITNYIGSDDIWIAKIRSNGNLQWQRTYGGIQNEIDGKLIATHDGGFIFACASESSDYDLTFNHGDFDVWVVKLSSTGNILWQKSYGGSGSDGANDIIAGANGNYYIVGSTNSNDGDIHDGLGAGDLLVMNIDSSGNLLWEKCLGGSNNEEGRAGSLTNTGGIEAVGYSYSNDSMLSSNHGLRDVAAFELDSLGNLLWAKSLGGSNEDEAYAVTSNLDGSSYIAGYSLSSDGDISQGNAGNEQVWLIKLSPTPLSVIQESNQEEFMISVEIKNGELILNYETKKDFYGIISLSDMNGKPLLIEKIFLRAQKGELQLPISAPEGVYLLTVSNNAACVTKKVVSIR